MTGRSLQLTGVEMSAQALYYALGCLDLTVLSKLGVPLRIQVAQRGRGGILIHPRTYAGCMLESYSRTLGADGDRIVRTNLGVRWLSTSVG